MRTLHAVDRAVATAQKTLNHAFSEYAAHDGTEIKGQFLAFKLQACIIQYEICSDFALLLRIKPMRFARKVFLKNALHKIVEYTDTLRTKHLHRIVLLAKERGLNNTAEELQRTGTMWRRRLNTEQFRRLRNKASGHYDQNIQEQVEVIDLLDEDAALDAMTNFLTFNLQILSMLKAIGANEDQPQRCR
jgi:hypothetical protein